VAEAVAAESAPQAPVAEAPPRPAVLEPPPAAVVAPIPAPAAAVAVPAEPPATVSPPTEPPVEAAPPRQQRKVVRKHRRPPVQDEAPLATASIPTDEAEPAPSAAVHHAPIAIVRGGAARPSPVVRAPGPHIIQVHPGGGQR